MEYLSLSHKAPVPPIAVIIRSDTPEATTSGCSSEKGRNQLTISLKNGNPLRREKVLIITSPPSA